MKFLLAVLLATSVVSRADPTVYQEQNFSIEFPADWQMAEVPPGALGLARSPDGTKGLVLMVIPIAPEEIATALKQLVSGAKKEAVKNGVAITSEQDLEINGVPFHAHSFTLPGNVATVSHTAVAGNWGYSVQGFSSVSDPAADPEVSGVIHSFKLISPPAATVAAVPAPEGGDAYQAGRITGQIAIMAFVVGAIFIGLRNLLRGKKASS